MALNIVLVLLVVPWLADAYPSLHHIEIFPDGYDKILMNLIEGGGYCMYPETGETMLRLLDFVFILVGIFYLFSKSLLTIKCFNWLCSLTTALVIRAVGLRFLKLAWRADLAAALYLLYAGTVFSESRAGVESVLALLVIGFIYLFYRALESNRLVDYLVAGDRRPDGEFYSALKGKLYRPLA